MGSTDDMVVIRGMNVYPSAIEEAVRGVSGSGEFRITFYSEQSGMDEIKLEVELSDGARGTAAAGHDAPAARAAGAGGPVAPGILPRVDGKTRRVVDERWSRS